MVERNLVTLPVSGSSVLRLVLVAVIGLPYLFELRFLGEEPSSNFHAYLILAIYAICFLLAMPFLRIRRKGPASLLLISWSVLFIWALLTSLWSSHPELVLQRSLMVFASGYVIILIVLSDQRPLSSFYSVMRFVAYTGVGLACLGLLIWFGGETEYVNGRLINVLPLGPVRLEQVILGIPPLLRISSLTGNPNSLAVTLAVSVVATSALFLTRRLGRLTFGLMIGIQMVALAMTLSRAGIGIALAMLGMLYIGISKRFSGRIVRSLRLAIMLGGWAMILMLVMPTDVTAGLQERVRVGSNLRFDLWMPVIAVVKDSPLTGVGFGVHFESILLPRGFNLSVLSLHLALMSELGFMGYIIVLWIWFRGIRSGLWSGQRPYIPLETRRALLVTGVLLVGLLLHQIVELSILRFAPLHGVWVYLIAVAEALRRTTVGVVGPNRFGV